MTIKQFYYSLCRRMTLYQEILSKFKRTELLKTFHFSPKNYNCLKAPYILIGIEIDTNCLAITTKPCQETVMRQKLCSNKCLCIFRRIACVR